MGQSLVLWRMRTGMVIRCHRTERHGQSIEVEDEIAGRTMLRYIRRLTGPRRTDNVVKVTYHQGPERSQQMSREM